ncbi:SMI1/KNR4 family protein [Yinghuangia seranimata]|uniref:SMI1/KNR4 family protein n=1 Tax=Yinghuangia seranimata TaxID=408067 RepID=UPI00248B4EB6|nr:SMI1/KNR4 family protein [Yinghuangia seranimata]MDI2125795.1 SMI1/KNR4 family protein [Yinghuangia seranimata]
MTTGFDPRTELAAIRDTPTALRFIERYAAAWCTAIRPGDGCPEDELLAAEARLGVALPLALRETYRLLGRRADLTSNQDVLLPLDQLRVEGDVLVYRMENQAVSEWGVLLDPDDPDPPTATRPCGWRDEQWEPWFDRFSLAAVEMVLFESVLAGDDQCDTLELADVAEYEALKQRYDHLPLPDYGRAGPDDEGSRWYANAETVVWVTEGAWAWARWRDAAKEPWLSAP